MVRLCLAITAVAVSPVSAESKPNILLMMADDLGYSDLSCYGSQENKTPELDRLAAQGVRFTDFYASSGVCSPSRAALLSGRFSVRAGVYSWVHMSQKMHLRREELTIAELMKSVGYDTAHVGKWHLGYDLEKGSGPGPNPGDQGFDHWMATGNNAIPSHRNPNNFVKNGVGLGGVAGYSCQIVAEEAIGWLDSRSDSGNPFFLNVWFHEPHAKVAAPPELADRHRKTSRPEYYGCIENMDLAVGRLLEKLEDMGQVNETLVIFTSDNGSYMKGSNDPLRGRKTQLWEGGIREPGIIRWPGMIKSGQVSQEPAGHVDLLPTLCEVAGAKLPTDRVLDGVSLLPLFGGGELQRSKPLYWFYNPSRPVCVIRDGDWCLTADPTIELPRGNMFKESYIGQIKATGLTNHKLYNLREDVSQSIDQAESHPKLFERLKATMLGLHDEVVKEAFDWRTE
jgi:arylsulfatase A